MENLTFYDFTIFVIDCVGMRCLFQISFQLPEAQKKYDFKWSYWWHFRFWHRASL